MAALAGYKASVYISTGVSTATTNEAMTNAGDNKTFSVTNSAHRYLDPSVPVVVQTSPDGTTWTTQTTGFTVQDCGGVVVFTNAVSGVTPSCRLSSANWLTVSQAVQAKSVEVQPQFDIYDISTFFSGAWKTKLVGLGDATIKLSQWWFDTFYINALTTLMVISIYTGANANQRLECYAYIKQDSLKIAQNAVIEESIDFEATGPLFSILS